MDDVASDAQDDLGACFDNSGYAFQDAAEDTSQPALEEPNCDRSKDSAECLPDLRHEWSLLNLSKPVLRAVYDHGFTFLTPIQYLAIPYILEGRDVLATAHTGSGKTAAFLVPILEKLVSLPGVQCRRRLDNVIVGGSTAIKVLILLPTRELAFQCHEVLQSLTRKLCITFILAVGGLDGPTQEACFRQRPDIVIATPGRMLDHLLNSQSVHFDLIDVVVLDEADRLIDIGFRDECLNILKHCSVGGRQTLLFSATLSDAVEKLAVLSLNQPIFLDTNQVVTLQQLAPTMTRSLKHEFLRLREQSSPFEREAAVLHLVHQVYPTERCLIFFRTKVQVRQMCILMQLQGIKHVEFHGNLTQAKRLEAFQKFRDTPTIRFMVCSELAARGLDIQNVQVVINAAPPFNVFRYIHQAGRTARFYAKGVVVTLYMSGETALVKQIMKHLKQVDPKAVSKLRLSSKVLAPYKDRLAALEPALKAQIKQDEVTRELDLCQMKIDKLKNCTVHAQTIGLRPKKRWIAKGPGQIAKPKGLSGKETSKRQNKSAKRFSPKP